MNELIYLNEIGQRIKRERMSQGLTQERLAEQVNVTPHYIYEIERGSKAMSITILASIASSLHISTDYILFGQDDSNDFSEYIKKLTPSQKDKLHDILKFLIKIID